MTNFYEQGPRKRMFSVSETAGLFFYHARCVSAPFNCCLSICSTWVTLLTNGTNRFSAEVHLHSIRSFSCHPKSPSCHFQYALARLNTSLHKTSIHDNLIRQQLLAVLFELTPVINADFELLALQLQDLSTRKASCALQPKCVKVMNDSLCQGCCALMQVEQPRCTGRIHPERQAISICGMHIIATSKRLRGKSKADGFRIIYNKENLKNCLVLPAKTKSNKRL